MRDEIPPLTRGLMLIDQLVQATIAHCENPHNRMLAERMAEVRTRAEKYTSGIERKAGLYAQVAKGAGGRKQTKGWTVSRTRNGKRWRGTTTVGCRSLYVGSFDTRLEAEKECKAVKKLREKA